MSLRHALLALLTGHPMTGYDLALAARSSVGYVWHAPDSQIYPELRRMESDGLLTSAEVPWGKTSTKRRYSITAHGERAFREWMDAPLTYYRERDPAHLKAAYLEWAAPDAAREWLHQHIAHWDGLLRQWVDLVESLRDGSNPLLAARMLEHPVDDPGRITAYKAFAYEGLIGQARAQIAWARAGLLLVDDLEGPRPPPTPG